MKLTVSTFVSVDGVMQGPGGPEEDRTGGFERGGWLVPHFDDETGQFMDEVFRRVDAFLLGAGEISALELPAGTRFGAAGVRFVRHWIVAGFLLGVGGPSLFRQAEFLGRQLGPLLRGELGHEGYLPPRITRNAA